MATFVMIEQTTLHLKKTHMQPFWGGEQNSHWRGRICAEAEATADGRGFALVGRQALSWDNDSWKKPGPELPSR